MATDINIAQTQMGPVVRITALHKQFGSHIVLNGFDLELRRGETVVILGRSGSGKSVLIKCVIGLYQPDSGDIEVFGQNVANLSHEELDSLRARIGFLFQSNALYDSMTVRENLEFPMRRHLGLSAADAELRIRETLSHVGLEHTLDMLPAELSGGMQKRIALARTLVLNPEVMLYDEPTTGLDPITGREISSLIVETQNFYKTSSIIISHDMKCVEQTADRIAMLVDGKCYTIDTFDNLKRSDDPIIKQFFQ